MKYLMILGLLASLMTASCAHQTAHEACLDGNEYERYGTYEACVNVKQQEINESRQAMAHAFDGFYQMGKNMPVYQPVVAPPPMNLNCTSRRMGSFINTTCN